MTDPYIAHYDKLVGKTVKNIAKSPDGFYGLVFNDNTIAWISQDPEGNGPGFLEIVKGGKK